MICFHKACGNNLCIYMYMYIGSSLIFYKQEKLSAVPLENNSWAFIEGDSFLKQIQGLKLSWCDCIFMFLFIIWNPIDCRNMIVFGLVHYHLCKLYLACNIFWEYRRKHALKKISHTKGFNIQICPLILYKYLIE